MPIKKKPRKKSMDPKLVAAKQAQEVNYIAKRFKIKVSIIRMAVKAAGRSRAAIYAWLRRKGYSVPTRKIPF